MSLYRLFIWLYSVRGMFNQELLTYVFKLMLGWFLGTSILIVNFPTIAQTDIFFYGVVVGFIAVPILYFRKAYSIASRDFEKEKEKAK